MGSAQRFGVARAPAPRDAAVQHCLEYFGFEHLDFELKGSEKIRFQNADILVDYNCDQQDVMAFP